MFCSACGKELVEGSSFCRWCGQSALVPAQRPSGDPVYTHPARPAPPKWAVAFSAAFILGIVVAIVVGIVGWVRSELPKTSSAEDTSQHGSTLNAQGVRLARFTVATAIRSMLTGHNSAITMPEILALMNIRTMATAVEYERDYDANEIAADKTYRGGKVLTSGTIESIEKDFTNQGYLTLASGSFTGVIARLSDKGMDGAEQWRKGQRIFLVCDAGERVVGSATLDNCETFNSYWQEVKPDITTKFQDFLSGQQFLPKDLATLVLNGYIIGSALPSDSPCFADGRGQECLTIMLSIYNDKAKAADLDAKVKQMMASLKVQ